MPAAGATFRIIVLWEDELRVAAKALAAMQTSSEDEFPDAAHAALYACQVALEGITDEAAITICGTAELHYRLQARASRNGESGTARESPSPPDAATE